MKMIFHLFVLTALLSCSNRKEQSKTSEVVDEKEIQISYDENIRPKIKHLPIYSDIKQYTNKLSEVAADIQFVELKGGPLFRDFFVNDIQRTDEYIFIMAENSIHQYDLQGKYIRRIGKSGRGPGEYVNIVAPLLIDNENKKLFVRDLHTRRMLSYSFEGKYDKVVSLETSGSYIRMDSTTFIVRTHFGSRFLPNTKSLELQDKDFKTIKSFDSYIYPVSKDRFKSSGPEYNLLWNCGEDYYTLEYGNDTVFQVTKEGLIPSLYLSGELALTKEELFKKDKKNKVSTGIQIGKPNTGAFESNRFLLIRMHAKNDRYFAICDKLTGELSRTGKHTKRYEYDHKREDSDDYFIDDIVSSMCVDPLYPSEGYAIGLIPATSIIKDKEQILQYIQANPTEEGQKLASIVKTMTEEDCSIACFIRFK